MSDNQPIKVHNFNDDPAGAVTETLSREVEHAGNVAATEAVSETSAQRATSSDPKGTQDYKKWLENRKSSKKSKSNGWKIAAIVALSALVLIVLIWAVSSGDDTDDVIGINDNYVAVIDVDGEISSSGGSGGGLLSSESGYDHAWTIQTIDDLIEDSGNKGIFMRVNTPGGSVYASDELYLKLMEYKEKTGRPIYAYFCSEAASGGYYISAGSDKIYANRNCWTGSIGVTIGTIYDLTGLMEKYGVKSQTITSGRNKAMGSYTQEMTDEQKEILQSLVDEAYDQFVGIVADGRKMSKSEVKRIADGRILTASQAESAGLIDGICDEQAAMDAMIKDEGLDDATDEYLVPASDDDLFSLVLKAMDRNAEVSEMSDIMSLIKENNTFSISYKANIDNDR